MDKNGYLKVTDFGFAKVCFFYLILLTHKKSIQVVCFWPTESGNPYNDIVRNSGVLAARDYPIEALRNQRGLVGFWGTGL